MEKIEKTVSPWRFIDLVIPAFMVMGIVLWCRYKYYGYVALSGIAAFVILLFCGKLYIRSDKRSRIFVTVTAVLRVIGYAVGILALMTFVSVGWDVKQLYPLQKALYDCSGSAEQFLPEKLPDTADDYEVSFVRSHPRADRIELSFFTDSETISEYRKKALDSGASLTPKESYLSAESWCGSKLEKAGVDIRNAEVFYYPDASEYFPKFYVLDEDSGFVYIYY